MALFDRLSVAVGSIGAARNLQALQREGITHVLNASPIVPCFHRRHLRYKVVTVYDDAQEDIAQFFDETNSFISKVNSHLPGQSAFAIQSACLHIDLFSIIFCANLRSPAFFLKSRACVAMQ